VESQPGRGSTFSFTLPVIAAGAAGASVAAPRNHSGKSGNHLEAIRE
jgi:hypothetical protein